MNFTIDAFCTCRRSGLAHTDYYGIDTRRNYYGRGSGPIWLSSVQCTGGEMSLAECGHGDWGQLQHCSNEHRDDIAVICDNSTCLPSCSLVTCCVPRIAHNCLALLSSTYVQQ